MPITAADTIAFVNDAGDTAVLMGGSYFSNIYVEEAPLPTCPPASRSFTEHYSMTWTGKSSDMTSLEIYIYSSQYGEFLKVVLNNNLIASTSIQRVADNTSEDSIFWNGQYMSGFVVEDSWTSILYNQYWGPLKIKDHGNRLWTRVK
jgi:hypothetical protein